MQVLERECESDVLAKKRTKLVGKRAKAFPKVSHSTDIAALLTSWGQAFSVRHAASLLCSSS